MKIKNFLFAAALAFTAITASAQTGGFSYQAVVRDSNGELVSNKSVGLQLTIADSTGTKVMYSETQNARTNAYGVLGVTVGSGTPQNGGSLSNVDWAGSQAWLHIGIDINGGSSYTSFGATKIQAVPYALYAARSGNSSQNSGANNPTDSSDALFEVKDNDGNVVFAVYPNEVRVYVDENDAKNKRSGLRVTGRNTKGDSEKDYLIVNPTGTQVIVDENDAKNKRSGLRVTGRNTKDDSEQDYLVVDPTGTQVIVDEGDGKNKRSGLRVTGRNTKGDGDQDYLVVDPTGTQVFVDENDAKNKRSGLRVTGRNTKGDGEQDYLVVDPTGTKVIVDEGDGKNKRSGLRVTGRNTKGDGEQDYLVVDPTGTQVIVDEGDGKNKRSGLRVTGRNTKGDGDQDYLVVDPAGTQVFVDDETDGKTAKAKFAVSSVKGDNGGDKSEVDNYLVVNKQGTKVFIDGDEDNNETAAKAKFTVSSVRSSNTDVADDFFLINNEGTKVFIDDVANNSAKAKFVVSSVKGGEDPTTNSNYLLIDSDSTRIYIDEATCDENNKSGFAVASKNVDNTSDGNLFNIDITKDVKNLDSVNRIYWYPEKNAFMAGNLKVDSAGQVGTNSFSVGFQNSAIGEYSQAMGYKSVANANYTTAIGREAKADSVNAYAFGNSAHAKGKGSYAIGAGAFAGGMSSFAIGSVGQDFEGNPLQSAKATADYAVAIGAGTEATANSSYAMGYGCVADLPNLMVVGKFNAPITGYNDNRSPLFVVGGGTATNRSNAFIVYEGGDIELGGSIMPEYGATRDLGSSSRKWHNLYVTGISGSGGININTNLMPSGSNDLGSNNRKWRNIYASTFYGTLSEGSDARLKKNVQTLNGALDKVLKLRGVTYYWKNREEMGADSAYARTDTKKHIGVIAQEIEKVLPELVNTDDNGYKSVEYANITPLLIEAIKEQQGIIESQQQRIEKLEKLVEELLKKQ